MSTRDRILDTALRLFNEDGVAKVSTNRIAVELDISSGNLHYHFKSKRQLVEWLYRRLETELDPIATSCASLSALDDVWLALHLAFETIDRYRFVYTDVDYLMREFPTIGERIRKMALAAIDTVRSMCNNLVLTGVMQVDRKEADTLAFQIVFTAICWNTFVRLLGIQSAKSATPALAAYHVLALLNPYLADDARHYMNYLQSKYLK